MLNTSRAFETGQILWKGSRLYQGHTGNGSCTKTSMAYPTVLCLQGGIVPWLQTNVQVLV